jgi:hypothetical protein
VLQLVDGALRLVEEPGTPLLAESKLEVLKRSKAALEAVVEVFGLVRVERVAAPRMWPPKGGFVPAWRRLRSGKLDVIPSGCMSIRDLEMPTQPSRIQNEGWQLVCPICGAKGACRQPQHNAALRRHGELLLRRIALLPEPMPRYRERTMARRAQRRAIITAAIAGFPVSPKPKASREQQIIQQWRAPKITTSRMPQRFAPVADLTPARDVSTYSCSQCNGSTWRRSDGSSGWVCATCWPA